MLLHVALMLIGYLTDTMTTDSDFWGSQKKNTEYHAQVQDKWITDGFIDFELNKQQHIYNTSTSATISKHIGAELLVFVFLSKDVNVITALYRPV